MATTAKVYLSDGLPIEVKNAHRVLYFPDGSGHILDKDNRPVFIAAPGRYVAIQIEYALDEEPEEQQKVPAPVVQRHTGGVVATTTRARRYVKSAEPKPPNPPVGEAKPAPESTPGDVKVTHLGDRPTDGETTHEMQRPRITVKEVPHVDFPGAPEKSGQMNRS